MAKTTTKQFDKVLVLVQKNYNLILEYLFPKFCVGCKEEGSFLCDKCAKKVIQVITQVCPGCGRISESGIYCELCRYDTFFEKIKGKKKLQKIKKRKPLQGVIAAAYYREGPMREIIHHFKYNSVTELGEFLALLLDSALKQNNPKIDIVTFAPLHQKRLAERGYNQAEILAKKVGKRQKLRVMKLLVKTKKTKRQVELKGKKRRENLVGVFKVESRKLKVESIENKNILIIDDIMTTGATLNECAKVLKEAGAKSVWGLVVARG